MEQSKIDVGDRLIILGDNVFGTFLSWFYQAFFKYTLKKGNVGPMIKIYSPHHII